MEDKLHSYLLQWTISFVKNKDIVAKKIQDMENSKDGFDLYVKYKDREQYFIIAPAINDIDSMLQRLNNESYFSIITINSAENFEIVLKNWNKFIHFKFLNIIFINPFSEADKKWIVFPHTHHKICDESSLKSGLKSLFAMVDAIEEQQFITNITG